MRTIRVAQHLSLDGIIQPAESQGDHAYIHGGWMVPYRTPEGAAAFAQFYAQPFDLLLGRRTYDLWAGFWPTMPAGPFATPLNAATKYVVTHRPDGLTWGPVASLGEDCMEGIRRLRAGEGPDLIVCGSGSVTHALLERGWVDELVLAVYPLMVGRGTRGFPDATLAHAFELVRSQATPTGVLLNVYRRVGQRAAD